MFRLKIQEYYFQLSPTSGLLEIVHSFVEIVLNSSNAFSLAISFRLFKEDKLIYFYRLLVLQEFELLVTTIKSCYCTV